MFSGWSWDPSHVRALASLDGNLMNLVSRGQSTIGPQATNVPHAANKSGNENVASPTTSKGKKAAGKAKPAEENDSAEQEKPVEEPKTAVKKRASRGRVSLAAAPEPGASPALKKCASTSKASAAAPKPKAAPASRKRKSDAGAEEPEGIPEIAEDDPRLDVVDETCQQIRSKIRRFIESGAMTVGEFQKAIVVTPTTYQRFMAVNGRDKGEGSLVYPHASRFFKKRELQGLKAVPPKKKAKTDGAAGEKPKPGGKTTKEAAADALDVGDVHLDGEDTGDVPVYDTCDEIRRKIRTILRKDGVTQAAFCRAIAKECAAEQTIQPRQLTAFLGTKGVTNGNTTLVFYGSYVFFEKQRVKDNKPKSKMRLQMEQVWQGPDNGKGPGKKGMNTVDNLDGPLWIRHNERAVQDKYGRLEFVKKGR